MNLDLVVNDTRHWLEKAVIGLNLCPFAKAVYVKNKIRYALINCESDATFMDQMKQELIIIASADPDVVDTSLLIIPSGLEDFLVFSMFLEKSKKILKKLKVSEEFQLIGFHPNYIFADEQDHDIANYTNRSPYPIIHVLREKSVERMLENFAAPEDIYLENKKTLSKLGFEGWRALEVGPRKNSQKNREKLNDC